MTRYRGTRCDKTETSKNLLRESIAALCGARFSPTFTVCLVHCAPCALLSNRSLRFLEASYKTTRVADATRGYKLLLTDFQALDQRAVACIVLALEVIEQFATAAYQTQQTATGMVILDIVFEMLGQISDACSDQGHLHFGGTRIALGTLKVGNNLRFLRGGNCHWFCSPEKSAAFYPLTGLLLNPNFCPEPVCAACFATPSNRLSGARRRPCSSPIHRPHVRR